MKYYSEKLNRVFDTAEACQRAEFEAKEKENLEKIKKEKALREEKERKEALAVERKADAEKVEAARKEMEKANKAYKDALSEFISKHGAYHFSTSNPDEIPSLLDILEYAFNW